jgi:long-subunit fatty acid transport protein
LNGSWKLRAGYAFIQGVVPEHTLGPENPDVDQHNLSIGAGWQNDRITLDGFYNLGLFDNQQVSNSLLSGSYDTEIHYFGISCGYRF